MKIICVYFDYDIHGKYDKLARVFEHSVKKNSPTIEIEMIKIEAPEVKSSNRMFESNTVKLELWLKSLNDTDQDCIFMDADMMVRRDISDVFDDPDFDIGITKRDGPHAYRLPMNGGVVFVRNNQRAKDFIKKWADANRFLYEDIIKTNGTQHHRHWRSKYGGMNQAAYGYLVNTIKFDAKIKEFLCSEWNACIEHWPNKNLDSRIVHIKSNLRVTVLSRKPIEMIDHTIRRQVTEWRELASEIGIDTPRAGDVIVGMYRPNDMKNIPVKQKRQSRYLRRYM